MKSEPVKSAIRRTSVQGYETPGAAMQGSPQQAEAVRAWAGRQILQTYLPAVPDRNPMFLDNRVYQGSSGKVYPLPCTDRIAEKPVDHEWQVLWIENEYVRVMILPEIGGRIHAIQDKTNGYDLIYNQHVIKPALVGLAGPWASGGIEFNWPQHHRPATFLPVDYDIEEHADGSKTVWCSDHDPMCRMKGMHGVCLRPGSAVVELKVRAYNRTPFVQTFLWWANVATRVHEAYQSFFPPDVQYVADHARRSMSTYPLAEGTYYGVNYGARGRDGLSQAPSQYVPPHCAGGKKVEGMPDYAPNNLAFYANIPTPCSYMCVGSKEDFFGGYDYRKKAGLIHIASHHISPGKKQWTWGNHEFGYAWDRNLTDPDENGEYAPYIEIMAGVYTDNQPDFSFLQPGETRTWSQYWYPIQEIGPALHANLSAALALERTKNGRNVRLGVSVTRVLAGASITLTAKGKSIYQWSGDLAPGKPRVAEMAVRANLPLHDMTLSVVDASGNRVIRYTPTDKTAIKIEMPAMATEPPAPEEMDSADELFITGQHLAQYRHATRCPTLYWREALKRDPLDSRCNNAMGVWHLRRGEFDVAETMFRKAIERQTRRNANPYDGEAYYNLGLCLRYRMDQAGVKGTELFEDAYASFYKATWNQAWTSASYHALAEMDCWRERWQDALAHLELSLRFNTENNRACNLKAVVLRKLGRNAEADLVIQKTLQADPLDTWTLVLSGREIKRDIQAQLDLAHDYARAGLYREAIAFLESAMSQWPGNYPRLSCAQGAAAMEVALPDQSWGALPMAFYTLGWMYQKLAERGQQEGGKSSQVQPALKTAHQYYSAGMEAVPDYCFPARLEEIAILTAAMQANPADARAPYYLGNLYYDRRRRVEGIRLWERSARLDARNSVVWRNLGIGWLNVQWQAAKARIAFDRAFRVCPTDARVLFERDQLWKCLGESPERRYLELAKYPELVAKRDDLSVEFCALCNQTGRHEQALELISNRRFQPWEGGEGGPLGQHVRTHLALGRKALAQGKAGEAYELFRAALASPQNLGEAKHLLVNQSDVYYWLGCACAAMGNKKEARENWTKSATWTGDFQEMSVRTHSEMTYYSALSWEKLGEKKKAARLLNELMAYARKLQKTKARIEYFATSLPTMLLLDDDIQFRQETSALFLQAQASLGLGRQKQARALLRNVLKRDPGHALAADLLSPMN